MGKAVNTVVDLFMHDGTSTDAGPPVQSQGTCVRTNAVDADEFSEEFSEILAQHFGIHEDYVVYLRTWIEQAFEIMCKLRGYKSEQVQEQRVLWSGHFSPWLSWQVAGEGLRDVDGMADQVAARVPDRELLEVSFCNVLGGTNIELQRALVAAIGTQRAKNLAEDLNLTDWLEQEVLSPTPQGEVVPTNKDDVDALIEEAMGYYDVDDDDKLHQLMWFTKRNIWLLDAPDLLDEELAEAMRSVLTGKNPKTGEKLKANLP